MDINLNEMQRYLTLRFQMFKRLLLNFLKVKIHFVNVILIL